MVTIGRVSSRPLIILNPTAGHGRAARAEPWLRERVSGLDGAELLVTRRRGEARERAADARRHGFGRVVSVGGDGTIAEIVDGLLSGPDPPELGIVPAGTGNDLARSLGLPAGRAAAWTVALGARTRPLDAAHATNGAGEERWYASAGGVGFDAQVAAAMVDRRGWHAWRAGYLLTTLSELRRFTNRPVLLTIDGRTLARDVLLVAVANGEYYGGGMRIAPGARTDDGLLDVCVVGDVSRMTALGQLANLYRGTHVRHRAVSMHTGSVVTIEGDPGTLIHTDGEPFGRLPLRITLAQGALRVAAPAATDSPPEPLPSDQ